MNEYLYFDKQTATITKYVMKGKWERRNLGIHFRVYSALLLPIFVSENFHKFPFPVYLHIFIGLWEQATDQSSSKQRSHQQSFAYAMGVKSKVEI